VVEDLQQLTYYIEINRIDLTVWTPEAWSIFGQSIQTNNDVEGWHHHLNAKAKKGNLPFYMLLGLLLEETELLDINLCLISEHRLNTHKCTKYQELQFAIFITWDKYTNGKMSVTQLLNTCAKIYHTMKSHLQALLPIVPHSKPLTYIPALLDVYGSQYNHVYLLTHL
jgi:hypothetical protein